MAEIGELGVCLKTCCTAVVLIGFRHLFEPMRIGAIVDHPPVTTIRRSVLNHCIGNEGNDSMKDSRESGMGGAVVVGRVGTGVLIATGAPGKW